MHHNHHPHHPHGCTLFPEVCPPAYAAMLARLDAERRAEEHQRTVQLTILLLVAALVLITAAVIFASL